jgi:phosphoglycolate phosphatase-like HAD superfamily hydrolase
VIVIGDTPFDVECAHAHGCIALAVATGLHAVEELRATGADVVVQDLSDPAPLFALIDGAPLSM